MGSKTVLIVHDDGVVRRNAQQGVGGHGGTVRHRQRTFGSARREHDRAVPARYVLAVDVQLLGVENVNQFTRAIKIYQLRSQLVIVTLEANENVALTPVRWAPRHSCRQPHRPR